MDSEYYEISQEAEDQINEIKKNGGRIVAVGTTTVRALETAATVDNFVKSNSGWTDKFIYPPYTFKIVDALITNFHVSGSTLFLLTCAFADKNTMLNAYNDAIQKKYRFHSYGDAMFIY